MAKFPEPPATLTVAPAITIVPAGALLWRVYWTAGAHPGAWNAFRFFGPVSSSRFDHHLGNPPAVGPRGILYAATGATAIDTCLAECFQASRVIDRARAAPWLTGFTVTRDLSLLDLTGTWATQAGASMAIGSGPRPRARRWSQRMYAAYPTIDGLLYCSSMNANRPALALYERALPAMPTAPAFNRALADPALALRIAAAASRLGYLVV